VASEGGGGATEAFPPIRWDAGLQRKARGGPGQEKQGRKFMRKKKGTPRHAKRAGKVRKGVGFAVCLVRMVGGGVHDVKEGSPLSQAPRDSGQRLGRRRKRWGREA